MLIGAAVVLVVMATFVRADIAPAAIFGDHMVLQRDKPVPVWGTADPGTEVTVAFAGQTRTVTAEKDGKWKVVLDPMKASAEGRTLSIQVSGVSVQEKAEPSKPETRNPKPETISFSDVLIGDVWIGSGQSNMQWDFGRIDSRKAREVADNPLIRYRANVAKDYSAKQDKYPGAVPVQAHTWIVMSGGTFWSCSADMFHFAAKLQKELGVPIGVIVEAMGFTDVAHWTPAETFNKDPSCLADLDRYKNLLDAFARQPFRMPTNKDYTPKPFSEKTKDWARQGGGYSGIKAIVPYAIRGVCWDQGESGSGHIGLGLVPSTAAMVAAWRRDWGYSPEELPFIQAQKPAGFGNFGVPVAKGKKGIQQHKGLPSLDLGVEPQENWQVQELIPYAYTANSMDPEMAGFHPSRKDLYGEAFADVALARCYGRTDRPYRTPVVTNCSFASGKALLVFKEVGDGLKSKDGEPLRGFFIAASDRVYFPAQAEIVGRDQVRVWADEVKEPALVMYGVLQGLGNLAGSDDLLAFPYRSEPWAMPDAKAVEARVWPMLQSSEPGPIQEAAALILWQMAIREADAVAFLKGALDKAIPGSPDHAVALMVLLGRHVQTGDAQVKEAAKSAFLDGLERGKGLPGFTSTNVGLNMKYKVADETIKELSGGKKK